MECWDLLLARDPRRVAEDPLYGPLLAPPAAADGCFVLGRIAQSLDGRIATANGTSFWISGEQDVLHTHRLRALFDAVLVGAGTVRADDPLLTTRHCPGPSPVRVVIDTDRRLAPSYRLFAGGTRTLLLCAQDAAGPDALGDAEVLRLPRSGSGGLDAAAVVAALAARGLRRIFVEGGGVTVSRFLAAGMLDRLHVTVAPLLLGAGIPAFPLAGVTRPEDGMRLDWQTHRLGADMLFDIAVGRARPRMTVARAFWTVAAGRGELLPETVPEPATGELRVRTLASGISRGTEATVFAGRVPPGQYAAMRAPLMSGDFPFPVKYGYSAVGLTDAGDRVFVLHPHQDLFNAPASMCVAVPDTVPTRRAVLAANAETALNICWDAAPLLGEAIMVIGAGVVGLLTASLLARLPAARVTVVDIDPTRAAPARALGADFALPADAPRDQDLIVHASASEAGLHTALACAAFEARIVEASWFADRAPALPLGEAFHARRLRFLSSQVGSIAPAMRGRRTHAQRLATALALLADPIYDVLLEPATAFDVLPQAMPRLLAGGLCHLILYGNDTCSA